MKRIGLIGGISWVATSAYYRQLNMEVARRLGGNASVDLVLRSLDFSEVLSHADNPERIARMMQDAADALVGAGAEILAVGSSTGHKFFSGAGQSAVAFLHIADVIRDYLYKNEIQRIGVLGTKFILNDGFLLDRVNADAAFDIMMPEGEDVSRLHGIIIDEIARQDVGAQSLEHLHRMVSSFEREGAAAVLLGSTELWYAFQDVTTSLPTIDTAEIHSKALIDLALAED